ncbi:hypothetical protein [Deinococcus xinjiangensis]|uniref:hypothetical protein n=1 Tax=Deinococcus xinjiangensis TaxID=457454 RepID=UPI0033653C49
MTPTSFDVQPMAAPRNIVKLPCGPVEVKWPGHEGRTLTINASYDQLDGEDAEAILILSTMYEHAENSLQFSKGGSVYHCKVLRCEADDLPDSDKFRVVLSGTMDWVPL